MCSSSVPRRRRPGGTGPSSSTSAVGSLQELRVRDSSGTWSDLTPGLHGSLLDGCAAAGDDIWMVGESTKSGSGRALHWDGAGWTELEPPTDLHGVVCPGGGTAIALGDQVYTYENGTWDTLANGAYG